MKTREKPQIKHNTIAAVIRERNPDFILFSGIMVYCDEFERFLEVITSNYAGGKMVTVHPNLTLHSPPFSPSVRGTGEEYKGTMVFHPLPV